MGNIKKTKKTKTSLSRRQKQIIQIIVQMEGKPITVAAIAEKLKVSSRTILRELPLIEDWMGENDFTFVRKTGVGLQIIENAANLDLIRELLEIEHTTRVLGKEERRRRLLGELLFSTEPAKAFSFTSGYGISEGTLFGDLDYLEEWLAKHDVRLIRRQGVGIFIEGEERAIRQAIVSAVFDLYDINQIIGILPIGQHSVDLEKPVEYPPLLSFLKGRSKIIAAKILDEFKSVLNVRFRDSAMVGLYIRIALAIHRIAGGNMITEPSPDWEELEELREYQAVKKVQKIVQERYDVEIDENEVLNLTECLSSARIWTDASFFSDPMRAINVRTFVASLVRLVENISGLAFHGNRTLMDDLVNHFSTIMDRNQHDMFLAYVQTAPIKKNYPEIFAAVETALSILGDEIYTSETMEADVGFVTMHFAAAAERIQAESEKVVIAVVCPLGVGASRMLATAISRSMQNVEIRRIISAFEISEEQLRKDGIDLIVSTTELNTSFPHVTINKILQTQDKVKLQNRIDEINKNRVLSKTRHAGGAVPSIGLEDIRRTSIITREIVELIENFRLLQLMQVKDYADLQEQAALLFARNDEVKEELVRCFQSREQMGSTYIKEMKIALLHCKSDLAVHCRFGFIRLKQPLVIDEGEIDGAIVMIAPGHLTGSCLEPMGRLSALLIEEPMFLEALLNGDTSVSSGLAESALIRFYTTRSKNGL